MVSIIGAVLTINCFRFKIVNADAAVYHYMKENPEIFPAETIDIVRENITASSDAHFIEAVILNLLSLFGFFGEPNIPDSLFHRHRKWTKPMEIKISR